MEDAGQKLKRVRERLGLRYRDVEQASLSIAQRRNSDEFAIALSRLADIENKGTVPTIYRLYSLCAIYRLDYLDVMEWYGVNVGAMPGDAAHVELERTHLLGFGANGHGSVQAPMSLDPGLDLRRTTHLSRFIQRWGTLPVIMLNGMELKSHRYGFVGSDDWTMHPIIPPGSLVVIDESRKKPQTAGWTTENDRPIYFFEHHDGFSCGWCSIEDGRLIIQPHPASMTAARVFEHPKEIEVVGQVTAVAMRLFPARQRRTRSATDSAASRDR